MHATRNNRRWVSLLICLITLSATAQNIPVPLTSTRLYDFVDELATEGIIQISEAVRPFSRQQVAQMLVSAQQRDSLLNHRQKADLKFYLNEFALERDTMREQFVQYTDHRTYNLSLFDPQFSYMTRNKMFKIQIRPILGAKVFASKKGAIIERRWGAEVQMDIAHHVSIWGSLRDVSWNGKMALKSKYYPTQYDKIEGAKLTKPGYLNPLAGVQYKEAEYGGDFSDSKGGISLYTWWGSISLSRENIRWGDAYHASNILSGHNPAVPQISLQLTPVWWLQFDYFHAWLVSNLLDNNDYYVEAEDFDVNTGSFIHNNEYRQRSKYMAANMFTFKPCKWVHFAFGNSIVYAERNPQAAYFIPIAFFKSLDHLLTKGSRSENQNSQVFGTISIYPVQHLKLYGSLYADEIKWGRLKKSDKEKNPISYLVGFDWTGWPLRGLSLKGEFMRSYIACYTHSIDAINYTSNSYLMGHYMGDNAQSIFLELSYRPWRAMWVALQFTHDTKYNQYLYLREDVDKAISQKPFDKPIYKNVQLALDFMFEVQPNMFLTANLTYNYAKGYDRTERNCNSEIVGTAADFLNKFSPLWYQGKNITASIGFSLGL